MDFDRARFLVSDAARSFLDGSAVEFEGLSLHARIQRLRKSFSAGEAAALSEQIELRERATARFGAAFRRWRFTREGLEMATHPSVAERRARRLAALDLPVADLTCGLGGDLHALAAHCDRVLGVERSRTTALLATHNTGAAVAVGDAVQPPIEIGRTAIFLDPSRRTGAARRFDPRAFTPRWEACLHMIAEAPVGAIKGPPGIAEQAIPPEAEVEFVQLGRSLREAAIYVGAGATPGLRHAVLLPGGEGIRSDEPESNVGTSPLGAVIYDPASCVTRSGLVRQLAHRLGAALIDSRIAYLTSDELSATPFADAFEVIEVMPFSLARLKKRLRDAGWAPVEIRRRGFPIEPDDLRRQLGRMGEDPVTLLCTTVAGKRLVVVARPVLTNFRKKL